MDHWHQPLATGPLLGIAAGAIALLLVLIIRFKVHAFLALTVVSLATGFATLIPPQQILPTMLSGFGDTLASVALLVGFGAMLGRLVEHSGGAKVLADRMVEVFGEKRAPLALGLASLFMGFPIFFDAGLVVMLPIIFAVARRLDGPLLLYGLPAAGAFSVMHVFVPPHPGPVTAIAAYGANPGLVLLTGIIVAFPMWYISGYLWGKIAARRYPFAVAEHLFGSTDHDTIDNPPQVSTVLGLLLIPLVLIFANTGLHFADTLNWVNGDAAWFHVLRLVGQTPVALLISVLAASYVLGWRRGEHGSALGKDPGFRPAGDLLGGVDHRRGRHVRRRAPGLGHWRRTGGFTQQSRPADHRGNLCGCGDDPAGPEFGHGGTGHRRRADGTGRGSGRLFGDAGGRHRARDRSRLGVRQPRQRFRLLAGRALDGHGRGHDTQNLDGAAGARIDRGLRHRLGIFLIF